MTIETENVRLQIALDAKSSSPKLLLEGLDADARMLNSGGGYGAPDADARMLGCSYVYGAVWEADSSRADSQQGMLTPPPIRRPGTFCTPNPDSTTFNLLSQWQYYINNNPTKAKTVFIPGEKAKLARLQRLGRCFQAVLQGTKPLLINLAPDSDYAVAGLVEIEDKLQEDLQDIMASADLCVLLWKYPN